MSTAVKGYVVSHKTWYAHAAGRNSPEIMIGLYHRDGGTSGEFAVRWVDLGGKLTPRLEIFDDAWGAFFSMPELRNLADIRPDASDTDVIAILSGLGFVDLTEYKREAEAAKANPLADPDNWAFVYAECRDERVWAYIGPEPQPWTLAKQEGK